MENPSKHIMPTKMKQKLLIAFCLMSLLPLMVSVFLFSFFIRVPFDGNFSIVASISWILLLTVAMALFGFYFVRQTAYPIAAATKTAKNIAKGNFDVEADFKGSDELEDLSKSLKVISQNAYELMQKVERLSLKDKLTGLYNAAYIQERLDEEIQRAMHSQCPCAFGYFKIDSFQAYALDYGSFSAEEALKSFAKILSDNLSQYDRAARVTTDEFAMIFPNRNKKKAIEIVGRIRKKTTDFFTSKGIPAGILTFSAGVSENPIDGMTGEALYAQAQKRMRLAKSKGPDGIEAFA